MENFFYAFLVLASIAGLTFIVERGLALRWRKVIPLEVELAVESPDRRMELPAFRKLCERNPSALSRVLMGAVDHLDWPRGENADAIQTRARYEVTRLERGLVILEIIVGIAPLLGLVGTVYGLIVLFGDMNSASVGDNATFARGIAIALRSTLMGLMVAIPSLIAWSYYNKKVETLAVEMETLCDQFLRRQYHNGSGS